MELRNLLLKKMELNGIIIFKEINGILLIAESIMLYKQMVIIIIEMLIRTYLVKVYQVSHGMIP
jgi:hypothetical protein